MQCSSTQYNKCPLCRMKFEVPENTTNLNNYIKELEKNQIELQLYIDQLLLKYNTIRDNTIQLLNTVYNVFD